MKPLCCPPLILVGFLVGNYLAHLALLLTTLLVVSTSFYLHYFVEAAIVDLADLGSLAPADLGDLDLASVDQDDFELAPVDLVDFDLVSVAACLAGLPWPVTSLASAAQVGSHLFLTEQRLAGTHWVLFPLSTG